MIIDNDVLESLCYPVESVWHKFIKSSEYVQNTVQKQTT